MGGAPSPLLWTKSLKVRDVVSGVQIRMPSQIQAEPDCVALASCRAGIGQTRWTIDCEGEIRRWNDGINPLRRLATSPRRKYRNPQAKGRHRNYSIAKSWRSIGPYIRSEDCTAPLHSVRVIFRCVTAYGAIESESIGVRLTPCRPRCSFVPAMMLLSWIPLSMS